MNPPFAAWGLTGDPTPLPGGHRNTVLRVGDHVLKSTRRNEAAVRWLFPVMDRAAACGLRAPRPVTATNGALVVDGWTCEPFCPGTGSPVAQIASRMTRLHELCRDLPQRPGFASARTLLETDSGGDVALDLVPPPLVTALRDAWRGLDGAETVVHGDLSAANILTADDGTVTLIDWDEARRDVAAFDCAAWGLGDARILRAVRAWEIACCWQIEPSRARHLAVEFHAG